MKRAVSCVTEEQVLDDDLARRIESSVPEEKAKAEKETGGVPGETRCRIIHFCTFVREGQGQYEAALRVPVSYSNRAGYHIKKP